MERQIRGVWPLTALYKLPIGCSKPAMSKALALVLIAGMAIQIIKPLGLPGLRKRSDFWKLAVVAMLLTGIAATLGHWG